MIERPALLDTFETRVVAVCVGRAQAAEFTGEGALVVLPDVNDAKGATTVWMIEKQGRSAMLVSAYVWKLVNTGTLSAITLTAFGKIDRSVNNASIEGRVAPSAYQAENNLDAIARVNLKGDNGTVANYGSYRLATGGR